MDSSIQWTISRPIVTKIRSGNAELNNFLSLKVYKTSTGKIITDVYYKETNSHEYLHFNSHHPSHVKTNIPYCLAKTIIISTSDDEMMEGNLSDLTSWLLNCGYPHRIIEQGIFNARLQGPSPPPTQKTKIPFISTYFSNYNSNNIIDVTRSLIQNSKNARIQETFKDVEFIHGRRQPPNILRQISNAAFITGNQREEKGIFHCKNSNCKICRLYLQACKSFSTRKGIWNVKCHIDCHSKNAIYYQVCNFCNKESNTGKTDDLRERTNNHISGSRHGNTSNLFDQHNYSCSRKLGLEPTEPYFKLYVFMTLNDYSKLRAQERHLHLQNHDTINSTDDNE